MSDIRTEIRKSFEGLSNEEVLNKLLAAGFNVSKGSGEINIKSDSTIDEEFDFTIVANYSVDSNLTVDKQKAAVFYKVPLVA